jgi:hypothetical protein
VVPACASLDCVTVFARSVDDAAEAMRLMRSAGGGAQDVWRRAPAPARPPPAAGGTFRFGMPGPAFLEWDGAGGFWGEKVERTRYGGLRASAAHASVVCTGGYGVVTVFVPIPPCLHLHQTNPCRWARDGCCERGAVCCGCGTA